MMREIRESRADRQSLLGFGMMTRLSSTSAIWVAAVLVSACAVYDSGLVQSNDSLSGGGSSGSSGGKSGSGATSGESSVAGKSSAGEAGANSIGGTGNDPSDGGESNGEAGEATGGTAGTSNGTGGGGGSNGGTEAGGTAGTATGGTSGASGNAGTGGAGGTGGTAPVAQCSDHPIPAKATWVATASSESIGNGMESDGLYNPATHMTDGSYTERWSSGKTQSGDEWIQIDFGVTVNLTGFTLNVNNDAGDYPRKYVVRVSNKSQDFAATVRAMGDGMPGNTVAAFPMVSGRYVTVRQTGVNTENTAWWTIAEVFATCLDN